MLDPTTSQVSVEASTDTHISRLRCEYLTRPLGIDETCPRLSYIIVSSRQGARQHARRIRVASCPQMLAEDAADLWDSGWVSGSATSHIEYQGRSLLSRMQCYWQVEVEDERGSRQSSDIAYWSMGLLQPADWQARWIAAEPAVIRRDKDAIVPTLTDCGTPTYYRKPITLKGLPVRACLYVSARGLVEMELCGKRVGEDLFAPEWTDYDTRIHYRCYDLSDQIRDEEIVLGLILGDGWWSGYVGWQETRGCYGSLQNSVCAQLEIEYANGRRQTVVTDSSWACDTGPIIFSDFMMGETYDARREQVGWSTVGFDASRWLPALEVPPPGAELCAQVAEPVRVIETIVPGNPRELTPGVFIFDVGQNISGWASLRVTQKAGTRVQIRFAERLKPDGSLYTENLRRAKSTDVYVCKGEGVEHWQPRFTFHGFQYLEVSGLSEAEAENFIIKVCVIHSAMPPAGKFECSNPQVNRLWLNGLWSQKDNFLSVPTDCPQRDERLGWMGDAQVFLRTASYNMDVAAFFTKWMRDVTDAQTEEGVFPDTAPRLPEGENFVGLDDLVGAAAWADAGVIIPHTLWCVYGDTRVVERHWDAMVAWLDYLEHTNPEYLRVNDLRNNYGDWLCIPSDREFRTHSPMKNLLATAYWADDAAKMAHMARALGRLDEARKFERVWTKVRAAFQEAYVLEDGRLSVETQTAYLLALAMNLLPDALRDRSAAHLVANIRDLDWHLSTGFVGIRFLNPVLSEAGYSDVAYRLLLQDSYPSWLYPVKHGATTIWERWNGWTEEGGFFDPLMNSFNHYSLGSVGEWLFSHVAGIQLADGPGGFTQVKLKPYLAQRTTAGGLDHAKARYDSLHGEFCSAWWYSGEDWYWVIQLPANTCASIWIPTGDICTVTVNDQTLAECADVDILETHNNHWIECHALAGHYKMRIAGMR